LGTTRVVVASPEVVQWVQWPEEHTEELAVHMEEVEEGTPAGRRVVHAELELVKTAQLVE